MDETKVEGISFDLTADHSNATASLDAVIKKLRSLKSLVANGAISDGLSSIGKALKNINKVGASDLNRVTRLVNALSGLKGIGVPASIADSIRDIADVAKGISSEDVAHIRELANSVGGFSSLQGVSGSAIRAATRNSARSTAGVSSDTQETLFGISEAAQDATGDLEAFARAKEAAFREFYDDNLSDPNINPVTESIGGMSMGQFFGTDQPFSNMNADGMKNMSQGFLQISESAKKASEETHRFNEEMKNALSLYTLLQGGGGNGPGGGSSPNLPVRRGSNLPVDTGIIDVDAYDKVHGSLRDVMDVSSSFSTTQEATMNIQMLASSLVNLGSTIYKHAKPAMESLFQTIGNVGKAAGKGLFNYLTGDVQKFSSTLGGLMHQIGRVALFRLLRTVIRDIGQAFTEGINNMYQWSLMVDRTFANAMDKIATASQYINNSAAAMVAPFLEYLAPVIDYIADKIVSLFNLINQLFALLSGRGYWTRAVKGTKEFAKAAGSAGSAAGGLKKQIDLVLASFDELHLLAKSSGSGGGGGGGGGAGGIDYGTMFENVPFDQTLKDLIDSENWFGLGEYFADKLNVITEAADKWLVNVFEPWAIKWATALGEIINGFVSRYNWELLGKTVADGLMAIIRAGNAFLTTTDFLAIGVALGTAVKSWFENMSWTEVAEFFANKLNAMIEMAKGFVLTTMTDGKGFGTKVAETIRHWFENVNWNDVYVTLKTGLQWAIDAAAAFVTNGGLYNAMAPAFQSISQVIRDIDWGEVGHTVWMAIKEMLSLVDWVGIGQAIGEFIGGINWLDVFTTALSTIAQIISGFLAGIGQGVGNWFNNSLLPTITFGLWKGDQETDKGMTQIMRTHRSFYDPMTGDVVNGWELAEKAAQIGVQEFTGTTTSELGNLKTQTDTKTNEIRALTKDNLLSGYQDATSGLPFEIQNYNTTANRTIDTSGTLNIGKQTEAPVSDNMLSGVTKATKDSRTKIAELVTAYNQNITTSKLANVADSASSSISSTLGHSFDFTNWMLQKIQQWISAVASHLTGCLNNVNMGTPKANMPTYKPSTTPGGNISYNRAYVTTMASGGIMDTGELYLAREDGAELIGRVGAQNAVMNNDQIVRAVSQGVAQAVAATMGGGGNNIHVELVGDAKGLFKAVVRENNSAVARTGNSPLLI